MTSHAREHIEGDAFPARISGRPRRLMLIHDGIRPDNTGAGQAINFPDPGRSIGSSSTILYESSLAGRFVLREQLDGGCQVEVHQGEGSGADLLAEALFLISNPGVVCELNEVFQPSTVPSSSRFHETDNPLRLPSCWVNYTRPESRQGRVKFVRDDNKLESHSSPGNILNTIIGNIRPDSPRSTGKGLWAQGVNIDLAMGRCSDSGSLCIDQVLPSFLKCSALLSPITVLVMKLLLKPHALPAKSGPKIKPTAFM